MIVRYPCGCEVESYRESCAHVDAAEEMGRGYRLAAVNRQIADEKERREEEENRR